MARIGELNCDMRTVDPKNEKSVYLLNFPVFD